MASFTPRPLWPRRKISRYTLSRGLAGALHSVLASFREKYLASGSWPHNSSFVQPLAYLLMLLSYRGFPSLAQLCKIGFCYRAAVPLQASSGPEGSRKLRFPDYMTTAQDGGKVVSLTHRPPLPPGNTPGTLFC